MAALDTRVLMEVMLERFGETLGALATAGGRRESLARAEGLLFLHTTEALRRQGLSAKVLTDLFGFASLTSLRRKLRKIREARLDDTRSLRQFILGRVAERGATRASLLAELETRDSAIVRGLIRDLMAEGVLQESGAEGLELARATPEADLSAAALEQLVHVLVGERSRTEAELEQCLGVSRERVTAAAERLVSLGVAERHGESLRSGTSWDLFPAYETDAATTGLMHHFHGVCRAIVGTVRKWDEFESPAGLVPPAVITATFEVTADDPLRAELLGAHERFCAEIRALYERHQAEGATGACTTRITLYAGTAVDPIPPTE